MYLMLFLWMSLTEDISPLCKCCILNLDTGGGIGRFLVLLYDVFFNYYYYYMQCCFVYVFIVDPLLCWVLKKRRNVQYLVFVNYFECTSQ